MTARVDDVTTAREIAAQVARGETSAAALVELCFQRIAERDATIHAFRDVHRDAALQRAAAIDADVRAGRSVGPLAGVPIAMKDNIVSMTGTSTAGSRYLAGYVSPINATVVERLEQAGAVIIGRTNCDAFAMGSSNEHCDFQQTTNPWDAGRVPGGSSGGSAAAVAAGMCAAAIGSDTGGSIRQPAAMCGVFGCKPSYGRVSRSGLVAFGSSLDQIGPITHTVADAALVLQTIAGVDAHDATSAAEPVPDYLARLDEPLRNLRIGVPKQYQEAGDDAAVARAMADAIEVYRDHGATIIDIDMPLLDASIDVYYVIAPAEASSNLARYDGIRYGYRSPAAPNGRDLDTHYAQSRSESFGSEIKRRILLGTYVLSAGYYDQFYDRALRVRRLICNAFDDAFSKCHALLGPTAPTPAFRIGEKSDPLAMYLSDRYTVAANIAGICAMSMPAGFAERDGRTLPVGVQLQCPAFDESTLFRVAQVFENATDHHCRRPYARAHG